MQTPSHRLNNFDFLRVTAAFAVLISHQFVLSGRPEPVTAFGSWGGVGVLVFFAISGFLVAGSWHADPHIGRFAARRLLRIWPALVCAVLLTVFVLGPLVTTLPLKNYWQSGVTWTYLKVLGLWDFHTQLLGTFPASSQAGSVSGSLWTIPIEMKCYALLALFGVLGVWHRKWAALILAGCVFAWFFFLSGIGYDNPLRMKLQMGIVFLAAVCMFQVRELWMGSRASVFLGSGLVIAAIWHLGLQELAFTLGLPVVIVIFGTWATPLVRRFGRFGDASYGLYIYAYPVQQTVLWMGGALLDFWTGLLIVVCVTTSLAFLSWYLVEKPTIALKRNF